MDRAKHQKVKDWIRSSPAVRNLPLVVGSLALALPAAEGIARLFYEPRSPEIDAFQLHASSYYQPDEELGWYPKANVHGRHDKPGSFATTFSTNSQGLRDTEHEFEREPGISRVVVLGDSFAWGFGVDDHQTFSSVLDSALEATEVINLGVTGYTLRQEAMLLNRLGWRYDPDVVLLTFVPNDIYFTWDTSSVRDEPEPVEPPAPPPPGMLGRVKRGLARHSALYVLFQDVTSQSKVLVDFLVEIGRAHV